ncbi:MAG: toll/interleukin-1 receptor domain-containing protein [Candidatus Methylophosphatis roskildensis]
MSTVFISYKREDEPRVGRIALALQAEGLDVWWDRALVGGENWRMQIQSALDGAGCVVVVWSRESVGPSGDFVRDEAGQGKRRGILVPVLIEEVAAPLGFGEIQAIDLSEWTGNRDDPFFRDLCEAVKAKLEGRASAPPKGPTRRLLRRLTIGSISGMAIGALAVSFNVFNAQDQLCGMPLFQPGLSDWCGSMGVGKRATREERIAWETRPRNSCEALRTHIQKYPEGAYHQAAADLLDTRTAIQSESWRSANRKLALFVPRSSESSPDEPRAKSQALALAQPAAERLCKGFAATTTFRLKAARAEVQDWHCERDRSGMRCGLEGEAVCEVEERHLIQTESCNG